MLRGDIISIINHPIFSARNWCNSASLSFESELILLLTTVTVVKMQYFHTFGFNEVFSSYVWKSFSGVATSIAATPTITTCISVNTTKVTRPSPLKPAHHHHGGTTTNGLRRASDIMSSLDIHKLVECSTLRSCGIVDDNTWRNLFVFRVTCDYQWKEKERDHFYFAEKELASIIRSPKFEPGKRRWPLLSHPLLGQLL